MYHVVFADKKYEVVKIVAPAVVPVFEVWKKNAPLGSGFLGTYYTCDSAMASLYPSGK